MSVKLPELKAPHNGYAILIRPKDDPGMYEICWGSNWYELCEIIIQRMVGTFDVYMTITTVQLAATAQLRKLQRAEMTEILSAAEQQVFPDMDPPPVLSDIVPAQSSLSKPKKQEIAD